MKRKDRIILNKLFIIASLGLIAAGVIFLCVNIFDRNETTTPLAIALACILLSNLFNVIRMNMDMFRFDAKTGYYLYPEAGDSEDKKLRMNRGSTYEANVSPRDDICITKHGLKIPMDATDYAGFVIKMKISEQEFMSAFC